MCPNKQSKNTGIFRVTLWLAFPLIHFLDERRLPEWFIAVNIRHRLRHLNCGRFKTNNLRRLSPIPFRVLQTAAKPDNPVGKKKRNQRMNYDEYPNVKFLVWNPHPGTHVLKEVATPREIGVDCCWIHSRLLTLDIARYAWSWAKSCMECGKTVIYSGNTAWP